MKVFETRIYQITKFGSITRFFGQKYAVFLEKISNHTQWAKMGGTEEVDLNGLERRAN